MSKQSMPPLNEADLSLIRTALENFQKEAIDKLRFEYDEIREFDRDYYERLPAMIASALRKADTLYDLLHGRESGHE